MTYTNHRDDSRASREDTPKWGDVSAQSRSSRLATYQEGDGLPRPEDQTSLGPPVA